MPEFAELHSVDEFDDLNRQVGWPVEYRQLRPTPFRARCWFEENPNSCITKEYVTGPLEVMAANRDDALSLLIPLLSSGELRLNGSLMDRENLFMLSPGSEFRAHARSNSGVYTCRLPLQLFDDIVRSLDPGLAGFPRGPSREVRLTIDAMDGLRQVLDNALFEESLAQDGIQAELSEAVERIVLSMLSSSLVGSPRMRESRIAGRKLYQRALEFIEENLDRQISVAEVCRNADVGVRTLERLFHKETGVSPWTYVKARRMNAVRRRLLATNPAQTNITRVAQEHGIAHLGRFSGEYRCFFGELPSETLGRSS